MKIALACRVYPTHRPGGMPFCVQDRARALVELGHEVHVYTTGPKKRANDQGVFVHYAGCESEVYSEQYADGCYQACRLWKPEIVHTDSLDVGCKWWDVLAYKPRTACTLHGFAWGSFLTQWNLFRLGEGPSPTFDAQGMLRERNALATFDTVIGVSRHEHWMLQDLFGLPQAKLVYNPIAPYFFSEPLQPLPEQRVFLCAAISGQGPRLFALAQKAADKAGVKLLTVSGKKRTEMPAVYDSVSALVVPTAFSQGFDLTVAESLARRRPVLCSAVGSYLREAEIEPCLITTPLGDVDALAKAMQGELPTVYYSPTALHDPLEHARNWLEAVA